MDKQKQIEEMAKIMLNEGVNVEKIFPSDALKDSLYRIHLEDATYLYNAGCRKIPENAVVLTNEEYEQVCGTVKAHGELLKDLQEAKSVFEEEMEEAQKEFVKQFEENEKEIRKKTAREICGMLDVLDASYKQKGLTLSKLKEWIKKNYDLEVK